MFQQLILIGNLGADPEMRYTPAGIPVTSFSVATSKSWQDANGRKQEKTLWFRVSCWRKLAETAGQYLHKGDRVMVVCEIDEARPWTDKQGNNRASLETTAHTLKFLTPKGEQTFSADATEKEIATSEAIPF